MPELAGALQLTALWGSDSPELGQVALASLGSGIALALSRGKFPKPYPHVDRNEDAVAAATDGDSHLLVVADGHSGFDAARAAVEGVLHDAPALLERAPLEPELAVLRAFEAAREAVAEALAPLDEPRRSSRTALSVALIGGGRLSAATRGDTVVVLVSEGQAELVARRTEFLGPRTELDRLQCAVVELSLADLVVVATDGLYDYLGSEWRQELARLAERHPGDPDALVGAAVRAAFAGGAGDNVAMACLIP